MGRKKKPFIDKKKAQRFQLVPRSQHDPLCGDTEETQYVLKPAEVPPVLNREEHLQEQHKYGIHFDDDYDYLQHLKEPKMCEVMEPVHQDTREQGRKEKLPQELFGSDVIVEGQLNKVLPVSGPQPDWDPDIVAALERVEVTSDPEEEEELEDDFVLMANGGEPGVPVYITEQTMEDDSVPWWHTRGDFLPLGTATMQIKSSDYSGPDHNVVEKEEDGEEEEEEEEEEEKEEEEEEEEEEVHRKVLSGPPCVQGMITGLEGKSAQFTEYSLSSSVVPRNDALTLLDERFEQFMIQYDDSQIGPLDDEEEILSTNTSNDKWLLEYAIQDFSKHHKDKLDDGCEKTLEGEKSETLVERHDQSSQLPADANSSGESDDCGDMEVIQVEERGRGWGRREQWDCESILSTYSNLYNHPTKIIEPREEGRCIKLSQKTGIPLGTVPGPLPKERHQKRASTKRQPGESKEEKKRRKQAVKEERRHCRSEKKATKLAFKTEQLKQERALASQYHTAAVV